MADQAVGNPSSQEINIDDLDPGAPQAGMIVAVDSYEDLSYAISREFNDDMPQRIPSGNISEIVRQGSDSKDDVAETSEDCGLQGGVENQKENGSNTISDKENVSGMLVRYFE